MKGENYARCLSFSPSGGLLAVGEGEKAVKIWDWMKGEVKETLPHNSAITTLAFYPDGNFLASGCESGALQVWKVKDGILLQKLDWHQAPLMSIVFSPDGRFIASGDSYGNINIGKFDEEVCEGIRQGLIKLGLEAYAFWEELQPIIKKWSDDLAVAKATPRISLPGVIPSLQNDKRQLETVKKPPLLQSILTPLLKEVISGMETVIQGLLEFAGNMNWGFLQEYMDSMSGAKMTEGELKVNFSLGILATFLAKYIEIAGTILEKREDRDENH